MCLSTRHVYMTRRRLQGLLHCFSDFLPRHILFLVLSFVNVMLFSVRYTNKKLSCCCDSRSYYLRCTVYWQTKPVSVSDSLSLRTNPNSIYASVTNDCDSPKFGSLRSQWITESNTTSARLIVCLNKTHVHVFFDSFFQCILCLNDTYYSKSVWRDK